VPPFGELGVTYTVYVCLLGKGVDDFLLVLIEHFSLSWLRRYEWILVEIVVFERWWVGHFERKFQGEGVVHQRLLASEN